MPAQLELEEGVEAVLEEQERHALERGERNSLVIAEVVGRNPARKPADMEPFGSAATAQRSIQRP